MQDWRRIVGSNVRRLRQAADLTQEQLAFDAKIHPTYVRGIEAGRRNPSLLVLVKLAKALKIGPIDLLKPPERNSRQ